MKNRMLSKILTFALAALLAMGGFPTATVAADGNTPAVKWLEAAEARTLASITKAEGKPYVLTRHTGAYFVRAAAWASLAGLEYWHDTVNGNAVQVRLYIAKPGLMKNDLPMAATSREPTRTRRAAYFIDISLTKPALFTSTTRANGASR